MDFAVGAEQVALWYARPVFELFLHLVVTAGLLMIVDRMVRGIRFDGWGAAFIVALALSVVNAIVRPVMVILTLPVTVVSLGLFLLVINAFMLWLAIRIAPGASIDGFGSALWGSLLLTILNIAIGVAFGVAL